MTTIALTGATGFVGRRVISLLLEQGHSVRALARPGRTLPGHEKLTRVSGTLADQNSLNALVRDCEAVIHIAAATSGFDYDDLAQTNVSGSGHLLDAIVSTAPQARLVHVSSLAAREPQLSDYAASKRAGEELVSTNAIHWLIIRPPAIYGPQDPALAPLWRMLARGWLPRMGPRQARFSLLHVDDLASALVSAAVNGWPKPVMINLHDGHRDGYSWPEIAEIAARVRRGRVRMIKVPQALLRVAGATNLFVARFRRSRPPVLVPNKVAELVHPDWVCDNTDLPGCPDWRPTRMLKDSLMTLPGWKRFQ